MLEGHWKSLEHRSACRPLPSRYSNRRTFAICAIHTVNINTYSRELLFLVNIFLFKVTINWINSYVQQSSHFGRRTQLWLSRPHHHTIHSRRNSRKLLIWLIHRAARQRTWPSWTVAAKLLGTRPARLRLLSQANSIWKKYLLSANTFSCMPIFRPAKKP